MKISQVSQGSSRPCEGFFFAALAALVVLILGLPAFPNGDGPLHAYYANVFGELASGATSYSQYYAIRHIVQPYCVHYLALVGLHRWLSSVKAEEVFVALILINGALGFRSMARRFGPHASLAAVFFIPLLLDWTLGAGFMNFCLGTGFAFWAISFWNGLESRHAEAAYAGCILMLALLALTHPVPLMVLILILACDLALQLWQRQAVRQRALPERFWIRASVLALACIAFLVPASLAERSKVTSVWRDFFPHRSVLVHFLEGRSLGYFVGTAPLVLLLTVAILLLFPATVLLLRKDFLERWRAGSTTAADRQLLIVTLFLISTVTMPRTVGGGANFSERMWDLGWPLVLATGASASLSRQVRRRLTVAACLLVVLAAAVAVPRLHALASRHYELSRVDLPRDRKGLLLEPFSTTTPPAGISYPVFWWSGVRAFTSSHAVLLNSPWLDQNQIPVKSSGRTMMPGAYMQSFAVEQPADLTRQIAAGKPLALKALHDADFLFYVAPNEKGTDLAGELKRTLGTQASDWVCSPADIYVVCRRPGA